MSDPGPSVAAMEDGHQVKLVSETGWSFTDLCDMANTFLKVEGVRRVDGVDLRGTRFGAIALHCDSERQLDLFLQMAEGNGWHVAC